jgi:hypothetical protein
LKQLRNDGKNLHVVEHLIEPLLASLTVQHDDPLALLRDIRDQRTLAFFPASVLERLATRLKETRKVLVSTKDVVDMVGDAIKGARRLRLMPESPSWEAWMKFLDNPAVAKFYRTEGYMEVFSEWPPSGRAAA